MTSTVSLLRIDIQYIVYKKLLYELGKCSEIKTTLIFIHDVCTDKAQD